MAGSATACATARFGATMNGSCDSPPEAHRLSGAVNLVFSEDDHATYT